MEPVESQPVLLSKPAADDARLVELQDKLTAQEAQMEILVASMKAMQSKFDDIAKNPEAFQLQLTQDRSKLGCKIGNLEASFNRHISDLNIKLSAEINMIHDKVHHNERSAPVNQIAS